MKIVRFEDISGTVLHGVQQADGSVTRINGDLLGGIEDSGEVVEVSKLLAPVAP